MHWQNWTESLMWLIVVQNKCIFLLWHFSYLTLRNCEKHGNCIYVLCNLKMTEFSPGLTLIIWIRKMSLYSPVLSYMLSFLFKCWPFCPFFRSPHQSFLCPSHHLTCLRCSLRWRSYLISLSSNQYLNKNVPKLS